MDGLGLQMVRVSYSSFCCSSAKKDESKSEFALVGINWMLSVRTISFIRDIT